MLKKLWIVCCAGLLLWPAGQSVAQVRVGVDGPIPLGKLDEMSTMLYLADAGQRAGLLTKLGVDPKIAKYAAEQLMPGQQIDLQPIRTRGANHYAIAYIPKGTGVCCFLYLLQGSDEASAKLPWHVVDHQQLDCWFEAASLELMPLRHIDEDDIAFHGVNAGHGSGLLVKQMQVFSVLNGKLQQTLAAEDYRYEVVWGGDELVQNQRSTFVPFPHNMLEETRTSATNDKIEKVERRYWRWSEAGQKFMGDEFVEVPVPDSTQGAQAVAGTAQKQ